MNLTKLAQRRVSTSTTGESLRQLSPQEVEQVAGAVYYGEVPHFPFPGPFPPHDPFPYHNVL